MANIRLDLMEPVINGQTLTFRSPVSCCDVTGIIAYYPLPNSTDKISAVFQFADAHGNNVGGQDLFAPDAMVKVIMDTELGRAYVQNADTNDYLEGKFRDLENQIASFFYAVDVVPEQRGTLTFTGATQSPTWSGYDPTALQIGGVTEAVNAGEYEATFTPVEPYAWEDGTRDTKTAVWKINRATVSIPSQSGTLTYTGSVQSPTWNGYDVTKMTIGGATDATNAGTYDATFTLLANYQWPGGDASVKTVSWAIQAASIAVPTQNGTLTYTGGSQSPAWDNYDASKMTLGGTTSAINVGTYNATFTLRSNFKWSDNTTANKTVQWEINKAAGSLTLDKTNMSLNIDTNSSVITVTRAGDGAISAVSSNTGIAAVNVSGNQVTVNAVAKGSAIITISVAEGTNHTAPDNKSCAVSVTLPTNVLNDNSWETIRQVSDAGLGSNYWAVGDGKDVQVNGTVTGTAVNLTMTAFILGFNHNSSLEGGTRIHFQLGKIGSTQVALCDSNYNKTGSGAGFRMNTSNTNSGGWNSSYGRKTLLGNSGTPVNPPSGSLLAALPSDLRDVIKPVTKYTDNSGNSAYSSGSITATTDYLFFLADFEVHGESLFTNSYEKNSQLQYDFYRAGNSKVRRKHTDVSTACWWWTRSACYDYGTGTNRGHFCYVDITGNDSGSEAWLSGGVAPGFCV